MNQATASSTSRGAAHGARDAVGALPLAAVVHDNGRERDELMTQVADALAAEGYRLGGAVQSNVDRPGRRKCDMYLRDLVSGEKVLISLDRGNEARGCRLDSDAFARVSLWGERALAAGIDLLVVNKFGKEETEGRGLRSLIAEALIADIPVILGVSTLNRPDLEAFAGETVRCIAPQREAILAWCRTAKAAPRV